MKPKDHRLRVGIALTAFTTLLFLLVFSLDSARSWFSGYRQFEVRFTDVQGLRPNDPVQFHGLPVGRVVAVRIVQSENLDRTAFADAPVEPLNREKSELQVALTLEVPSHIYDCLRDRSRATIKKTLTGVTVVNLEQGSGDPLGNDSLLIGQAKPTIDEVTAELHSAAGHLTKILSEIEPVITQIRKEGLVPGVLARLDDLGGEATELVSSLRLIVQENRIQISETIDKIDSVVASFDEALPAVVSFFDEAKRTADRAGQLSEQMTRWVADNRSEVDSTVENLQRSANNLRVFSTELRLRPWRLLAQPGEDTKREIALYETCAAYTESVVQLRRTIEGISESLKLEHSPEARTALEASLQELQTRMTELRSNEGRFWEELKRL